MYRMIRTTNHENRKQRMSFSLVLTLDRVSRQLGFLTLVLIFAFRFARMTVQQQGGWDTSGAQGRAGVQRRRLPPPAHLRLQG